MTSKLIFISLLFALTTGCKKNRTCACGHPRMEWYYEEIYRGTKESASAKCKNLDKKFKQEDPEYSCSIE
jgi:hypothetical protein